MHSHHHHQLKQSEELHERVKTASLLHEVVMKYLTVFSCTGNICVLRVEYRLKEGHSSYSRCECATCASVAVVLHIAFSKETVIQADNLTSQSS